MPNLLNDTKELKDISNQYKNTNLYSLIRKNILYVLCERSVVPIVNFLITVYLIRNLTISDYGTYNILLAIMAYISLFSSSGLVNIFRRYIPEFYEKKQISNLKTLVKKGLVLRFLLSFIIIIILIILSGNIGSLLRFENASKYLTIFSIAIIFSLQGALLTITLTSLFQHKKYMISQVSYVLFRAIVIYYFLTIGRGLTGLLIAESLAFGFLFILLSLFYIKKTQSFSQRHKEEFPTKRIIRFGVFDFFNEMGAQVLNRSTDYFVISAFLSPGVVGFYAFANQVIQKISHIFPQSIFMNLIRPSFFTRYTQNNEPISLDKSFNFLLKAHAFFVFPMLAGIFVLGDKLIRYIFDPKYLEAFPVLVIVASFSALNAFQFPLGLVVQSIERVEINLYSKIFAIYNLILDIIVVKPFGIIGIALVTSSAILFKNIFIYILTSRYTSLNICWFSIFKICINSLLMGIILFLLEPLARDIYSFIFIVVLGSAIYLIISYFNKVFNEVERKAINMILPKPIFVF